MITHIPVLKEEIIKYLDPRPNENLVDCTIGEGSHTLAILERNKPKGKILGIDRDPVLLKNTKYKDRVLLVCDNFANLKKIVKNCNFKKISGVLFDLGMSSWHLERSGRGFSFKRDEPLNMRYDLNAKCQMKAQASRFAPCCVRTVGNRKAIKEKLTAEKIINEWGEKALEKIFKEYGEERFSKGIAREIIKQRKIKPIKTTFDLVKVIKKAVPFWYQHRKIHFATKTFQALRISVNDELNNLRKVLPQAIEVLMPKGKLVVISFHSLEDRIVKNFLRENSKILKILTKKPIRPTKEEIQINKRARSAKLRAAEKL